LESYTPSQIETEGVDLIADPIYNFVRFTIPTKSNLDEVTERTIINSQWLQRLREIYQLQTVRWVYPGGEHTRFQHAIGAMHLAGRFARRLYDSLKENNPDAPSRECVEETMRITGLLHDVGHGPFGHFFDSNFLLPEYNITHEDIGQRIAEAELSPQVGQIRRSPSGRFENDETVDTKHVAYLMKKEALDDNVPEWVVALKPIVTGIYTIDNLDYVSRDSYACGLSTGSLFVDRLLHYTSVSKQGVTLHQRGIEALKMFLTVKAYLFSNVYFHRTARALDLHLKDIFRPTLRLIVRKDPRKNLANYARLTDHSLFAIVRSWEKSSLNGRKRKLGAEWSKLLARRKKWIYVCGDARTFSESLRLTRPYDEKYVRAQMDRHLPKSIKYAIDISTHDPRPGNLTNMGQEQFYLYEEEPGKSPQVNTSRLEEHFEGVASLMVSCRIYATNRQDGTVLAKAFRKAIRRVPSEPTAM
jgi:HD superfamily phosphohydrolase